MVGWEFPTIGSVNLWLIVSTNISNENKSIVVGTCHFLVVMKERKEGKKRNQDTFCICSIWYLYSTMRRPMREFFSLSLLCPIYQIYIWFFFFAPSLFWLPTSQSHWRSWSHFRGWSCSDVFKVGTRQQLTASSGVCCFEALTLSGESTQLSECLQIHTHQFVHFNSDGFVTFLYW